VCGPAGRVASRRLAAASARSVTSSGNSAGWERAQRVVAEVVRVAVWPRRLVHQRGEVQVARHEVVKQGADVEIGARRRRLPLVVADPGDDRPRAGDRRLQVGELEIFTHARSIPDGRSGPGSPSSLPSGGRAMMLTPWILSKASSPW
jgi:hypothetical protein